MAIRSNSDIFRYVVSPRDELISRLRDRRPEIEQALLARVGAIPDSTKREDPEYVTGFRSAVSAAFDYSLEAIEAGDTGLPPIPGPLLKQARLAARNSAGLDAVMCRYLAASRLLDGFILEEADPGDWEPIHRSLGAALDPLASQVGAEYVRERARRSRSRSARKLENVERLLDGEPMELTQLGYDLDLRHVGLIATGHDTERSFRDLAHKLDCRLLVVSPDDETVWAWLGRRGEIDRSRLVTTLDAIWNPNTLLAVGEADCGLAGWRRSHQQAKSALVVAQSGISSIAHYRRDCLLAFLLENEPLASLLWSLYIAPLLELGERSAAYLRTLRAYFNANRNGTSTAAALGVSRQTVANHLCAIESRVGTSIADAGVEMELALRLRAADSSHWPSDT